MAEDSIRTVIALPDDYVVLDLETTGLDYYYDNIIELAAIRYRGGQRTETLSSLVRPPEITDGVYIASFIEELTGITNEMLAAAPALDEVLPGLLDFIGTDTVIGHNIPFDARFIAVGCGRLLNGRTFDAPLVDTLRISRKLLPELKHHRLADLAAHYKIEVGGAHRSGVDCETTDAVYRAMRADILERYSAEEFAELFVRHKESYNDYIHSLQPSAAPEDSPILGMTVVFTGTLERMPRKDALGLVAKMGGLPANAITSRTDLLVVGTAEYSRALIDGKTGKLKKAEELAQKGSPIRIISEAAFFDLIDEGDNNGV